MNENGFELMSVSSLAKRLGVSSQTIYNRIAQGLYDTVEFKRGSKMRGFLIKVKTEKQ